MPCFAMFASPQVEEREDEDPDQIDEVPVEPGDLDDLVTTLPTREEPAGASVEIAAQDFPRDDDQKDDADRYVRAVKAGDHEEGGAELRRAPGVFQWPDADPDQLRLPQGLHAEARGPERGRRQHQDGGLLAVSPVAV